MPHVRNGQVAKLRRQTTALERIEFYATEEGLHKRFAREEQCTTDKKLRLHVGSVL